MVAYRARAGEPSKYQQLSAENEESLCRQLQIVLVPDGGRSVGEPGVRWLCARSSLVGSN